MILQLQKKVQFLLDLVPILENKMFSCNLKPFFCFQDQKFDIGHLAKYFQSKRADGDLAIYYELEPQERVETRGILEVCPFSKRISRFLEKPKPDETTSRNASVVFYFFRSQTRKFILKLVFNYGHGHNLF